MTADRDIVAAGVSAAPDPRTDGWLTEAFAEAAQKQLGRLGQLAASRQVNASVSSQMTDLVASSFRSTPLRPERLENVFNSRQFSVLRMRQDTQRPSANKPSSLHQLVRELRLESIQGVGHPLKFKVVQVDGLGPGKLRTAVYVSQSGVDDEDLVERNARWQVDWLGEQDSETPLLEQIVVESFEEVRYHNTQSSSTLFSDCTGSVFDGVDSFHQQLAFGQSHWQRRIEAYHFILNPAQNGLSIGDANGDGLDDVYVCQPGGLPNRLYLHQSDGSVIDASSQSGLDLLDNSRCSLFIDFDNDGDQDLIVSTSIALIYFRNDGHGRFSPIKVNPTIADAYSLSAADFDSDGDLDIYACRYFGKDADVRNLPVPVPYFDARNGGRNFLIRNEGRWQTSNATDATGIDQNNHRFSYAAIWIDFDKDGDQDLYVANDFGRNNLYRNERDETGNVRFHDVAMATGLQDGAFGMSAAAADFRSRRLRRCVCRQHVLFGWKPSRSSKRVQARAI